jgi:hypothetical protein
MTSSMSGAGSELGSTKIAARRAHRFGTRARAGPPPGTWSRRPRARWAHGTRTERARRRPRQRSASDCSRPAWTPRSCGPCSSTPEVYAGSRIRAEEGLREPPWRSPPAIGDRRCGSARRKGRSRPMRSAPARRPWDCVPRRPFARVGGGPRLAAAADERCARDRDNEAPEEKARHSSQASDRPAPR